MRRNHIIGSVFLMNDKEHKLFFDELRKEINLPIEDPHGFSQAMKGGGLDAVAEKVIKRVHPDHAVQTTQHIQDVKEHLMSRKDTLPHTKKLAGIVADTYKPVDERADSVHFHRLSKEDSDDWFSVYINPTQKKAIVGIRGTRDAKDLLPDAKIAVGTATFNKELRKYKKLKEKYKDYDFTIAGHSLGGTKALYIGEKTGDRTHAFNPGYSYYFENAYDLDRDNLMIHTVDGDLVSNQILLDTPANVQIYQRRSILNPLDNHTIKYWT